MKYEKLELAGSLLVDGFSIYLIEIEHKGINFYYVGMTGDGHYRSARAGFYRLAGHLEYQNKRSTQNQLLKGLMKITGSRTRNELSGRIDDARITFHHFGIDGFTWNDTMKLATEDKTYQTQQRKVLAFERFLIFNLRKSIGERLLNETDGKSATQIDFPEIFDRIIEIVK